MKKLKLFFVAISFLLQLPAFAQVQVDHPIQLTGSGANAKIMGIQNVSNPQDATSAQVVQSSILIYATATGNGSNFILNITPAISAYDTGMMFNFLSNQSITGPATLNVDNLGAIAIKKNISQGLAQCDIQTGQMVTVVYDGTNFQMISMVSGAQISAPVATAATGVTSHQITANWNSVSGATGYQLDVSTASNFYSLIATYNTPDTSYNVAALTAGTTYYYRVQAVGNCGTGGNSNTITVTTLNIANSIISYWTLDGNSNDTVGTNNGTGSNITYSYANGKINEGAGFNGNSSDISLGNIVSGQVNLTLTAWINTSDNSATPQVVIAQRDNQYDGEFVLYLGTGQETEGSGQLSFWDYSSIGGGSGNTGFNGGSNSTSLDDGNWHFIAFTKNGTTGTFYVDGVANGTITAAYSATYGTMTGAIGFDKRAYVINEPPYDWFNGNIDEVGVWERPLSAAEIAALYNNGTGLQYPF